MDDHMPAPGDPGWPEQDPMLPRLLQPILSPLGQAVAAEVVRVVERRWFRAGEDDDPLILTIRFYKPTSTWMRRIGRDMRVTLTELVRQLVTFAIARKLYHDLPEYQVDGDRPGASAEAAPDAIRHGHPPEITPR